MRPGLKTALTFTAGLAVGAVGWGSFQMHNFMKFMNQFSATSLNQEVLNLQFLASEKRTRIWRESLFEGLPDLARTANVHREDPNYAGILWNIRLVYSLYDRPVPKELEAILSNLPPDAAPQCPMPRRKLGLPPLPTQAAPKTSSLNDPQL